MKKTTRMMFATAVITASSVIPACGSKNGGGGEGDEAHQGDGDAPFGDGDSDSGDGDSLDQGSLSANCSGITASDGDSCGEPGLVCADSSGTTCVCGGIEASSGDGGDDRFGRPGNNDPDPGSGVWECFSIGPIGNLGGAEASGDGDASGGADGTGATDGSGGGDGSGGAELGGQGGAFSSD